MRIVDDFGICGPDRYAAHPRAPNEPIAQEAKVTPRIIGFTGLKGSGKDTAASTFLDHGWKKIALADPLKAMVRSLMVARGCGVEEAMAYTDGDLKETPTLYLRGKTARLAMQTLGTEWGRESISDDLWTDTWALRANAVQKAGDGVVVTDVRFQNEVDTIRRLGGQVFRIDRGASPIDVKLRYAQASSHASESHVEKLDVDGMLLNNFDTAAEFRAHVERRFF